MSYIGKLLKGAFEKNINAKATMGKYRIDLEYIKNGVTYIIYKDEREIAFIARNIVSETFIVNITSIAKGQDIVNIHSTILESFPKWDITLTIDESELDAPDLCPICKSDNIEVSSPFESTDRFGFQDILCRDCGKRWSENWKLVDINILRD